MLYLNGKYLDVNDKNGDMGQHARDYQDKVAKLRTTYGQWLTIKTKKEMKINPTGIAEAIPTITVPLISVVAGPNGTEEWAYSENAVVVKDGQMQLETRQFLVRNGEVTLDLNTQPDLAYYLTEKHPFMKSGKLRIHDERELARSTAEDRRLRTRVESAIYNETSTLNVNRNSLETVCKRWGITGTSSKTKDQLQNELYDRVLESEARFKKSRTGRGIQEFLEDARGNNDMKVGAYVNEAIENGVVVFNPRALTWEVETGGAERPILVSIPATELNLKEEILIDAVLSDAKVKALLENALGRSEVDPAQVLNFDIEDVRNTSDYKYMQRMGKELKLKVLGVPKEELREAIVQALHARQTETV